MLKPASVLRACLLTVTALAGVSQGGLIQYSDRASFEDQLLPGFSLEDFEDNRGAPGATVIFTEPLNETSSNAAFAPGSITPELNLFVAGGGSDMVLLNPPAFGSGSSVVGAARGEDDLVISFRQDPFAVGFEFQQLLTFEPRDAVIQVFSLGSEIGRYRVSVTREQQFFGVVSDDVQISALVFRDPIGEPTVGELVDNITFGEAVPEPQTWVAMLTILCVFAWRQRRKIASISSAPSIA